MKTTTATRKASHDIPAMLARADLRPDTVNEENRTVDVVFSTGARGLQFSWDEGYFIEELSLKKEHVRLELLNKSGIVLDRHNHWGDSIGRVSNARNENEKELTATLRFGKRGRADDVFQDMRDGLIPNVSVGYRVYKYEERFEGEGKDRKRILRAIDWEPYEISPVPIAFDKEAVVRSENNNDNLNPCEFIFTREENEMKTEPTKPAGGAPESTRTEGEPAPAPSAPAPDLDAIRAEAAENARKDELARVQGIQLATRNAGFDEDYSSKLVTDGVSLDAARAQIIDDMGKKDDKTATRSTNVTSGAEERDHFIGGASRAILNRFDPTKYELDDNSKRFRGLSVADFAKEALDLAGVKHRGLDSNQLWERAMNMSRAGGMHTTSDFPELLANVANKTLRDAYAEAPQTFRPFTREVEVADFKEISKTQLGDAPNLLKTPEHGEVKRGTIGEAAEKYSIDTYERIVAVTRKAIINDDLDAFTRIPQLMGRAARDLEADLVYSLILTNAAMGDGNALFSAAHGNVFGAAGDAIDVANVDDLRVGIRNQVGLNGRRLNLMPKYFVVPSELETSAEQFTGPINPTTTGEVVPANMKLQIVTEPRLSDAALGAEAATNVWYMFSEVGAIDMIELAKLRGLREPSIMTRVGWDVEGMEIKVLLDVGAKVIDWRGMARRKV